MANTVKNTAVTDEVIPAEAKKAQQVVKPHKCILTWNEDCILNLFVARRGGVRIFKTIFPGNNTVDSTDVIDIYKNNIKLFNQTYNGEDHLKFKGIEFELQENGEYTMRENWTLQKTTAKDFSKLIANTVNKESLEDLSNPDNVSIKYVDIAAKRVTELNEYTGYVNEGSDDSEE